MSCTISLVVSNMSKDTSNVSKCVEDSLCQNSLISTRRVFAFSYSGRVHPEHKIQN